MMRRFAVMAVAAALSAGLLTGCTGFDPTDWTKWLDTKKPLPGNRQAVFPEGVPGVDQGVPSHLVKGAQPTEAPATPIAMGEPDAEAEPAPVRAQPKAKAKAKAPAPASAPRQASAPAQPRQPPAQPAAQPQQPAQPAARPQQQQPSQQQSVDAPWPTAPAPGGFSR